MLYDAELPQMQDAEEECGSDAGFLFCILHLLEIPHCP
jgi:hypothetical protein